MVLNLGGSDPRSLTFPNEQRARSLRHQRRGGRESSETEIGNFGRQILLPERTNEGNGLEAPDAPTAR